MVIKIKSTKQEVIECRSFFQAKTLTFALNVVVLQAHSKHKPLRFFSHCRIKFEATNADVLENGPKGKNRQEFKFYEVVTHHAMKIEIVKGEFLCLNKPTSTATTQSTPGIHKAVISKLINYSLHLAC